MPFVVSPSDRSSKSWGNLARWPLRLDFTILFTAFATLLFSLSSGVFHVGIEYERWRHDSIGSAEPGDAAARISLDVVVPLLAMGMASVNIWLYTARIMAPGVTLATSLLGLIVWIVMTVYWIPLIFHPHGLTSLYAVRVLAVIGALAEGFLNTVYIVYSAIAVHRLRKRGLPQETDLNALSAHELESSRVTYTNLANDNIGLSYAQSSENNSGLALPNDYPRRRTSATPSFDVGKGPSVESRQLF